MNLRDIAREAWIEKSKQTEDTDECWQSAIEAVLKAVAINMRFSIGPLNTDKILKMKKEDL